MSVKAKSLGCGSRLFENMFSFFSCLIKVFQKRKKKPIAYQMPRVKYAVFLSLSAYDFQTEQQKN